MSERKSAADAHATQGFATRAIHAGYEPDPLTGAVNVPIYASSTFAQDGVGGMRGGFEYARTGNPTRQALEANAAQGQNKPLGPLDQAADHLESGRFSPSLDIGNDLGTYQGDKAGNDRDAGRIRRINQPPCNSTEQCAIGDAITGRIQGRTKGSSLAAQARHGAVEHVESGEETGQDRSEKEVAGRNKDHRNRNGDYGTHNRDHIRGQA